MTTTRRRPLSQEEIEAFIHWRICQLKELAARTAVEYGREVLAERLAELGIPPPTYPPISRLL